MTNPGEHIVDKNQGKAVIAGFHSETSEPEVIQLLKESITEIGMTTENARIECPAKPITHVFIHFKNDDERNKYIRSANMLRKELRGRKSEISRSMDAEERFHQKRMWYVKYCIHVKHIVPLDSITTNWTLKHIAVKGQIVVKTCQSGNLKYIKCQDIETEVEGQVEKWQSKTHRNDCEQSRERSQTKRRRKDYELSDANYDTRNLQSNRSASEGGGRDKLKKLTGTSQHA